MQKYKVFIAEDETGPLGRLLTFLSESPEKIDINNLTIARSYAEAVKHIKSSAGFDLSIIDNDLNDDTGFKLLTKDNIPKLGIIALNSINPEGARYASLLKGIGGYITVDKPFNDIDIKRLVDNLPEIPSISKTNNNGNIENFNEEIPVKKGEQKSLTRLVIYEGNAAVFISPENIFYIEVIGNYVTIHYLYNNKAESHRKKGQLVYYIERLDPNQFYKLGKNYLLNLNRVDKVLPGSVYFTKWDESQMELFISCTDAEGKSLLKRIVD